MKTEIRIFEKIFFCLFCKYVALGNQFNNKNLTQNLHFKVQYLFEKQSIKIGCFDCSPAIIVNCFLTVS